MKTCPLIAAVVCANGLGHFRRITGILAELLRSRPQVRAALICQRWQAVKLGSTPSFERLLSGGATLVFEPSLSDLVWRDDPEHYSRGGLLRVGDSLRQIPEVMAADLVVSDNLVAVLDVRPDAVLCGSFLWSDVLSQAYPESESVRSFAAKDRELLAKHRPSMICVRDLAMPAVWEWTNPVPVGWMCQQLGSPRLASSNRVTFLVGSVGAAGESLRQAADLARRTQSWELEVPQDDTSSGGFDYSFNAYARNGAIACRPGVGSLTDCVAATVPVAAVYERHNAEMSHNAQRIHALSLGVDVGPEPPPPRVIEALSTMLSWDRRSFVNRVAAFDRNGLRDAASWLAERLPSE